jgi:FSR family fosmidomycin resistance protein-like MFS transporter
LVLASLGSAAFHPAGTSQATLRGRTHFAGRETSAAAYFFVFGQMGLLFGPVVSGPVLEKYHLAGMVPFALLALPVALYAARELRWPALLEMEEKPQPRALDRGRSTRRLNLVLVLFALLAAFQSWSQQNIITFIPKYLSDLGQSPAIYGLIAATFMGGSAIGNLLGGSLADRYGKRRIAFACLALASLPLYLISAVGWSPWLFLLVPLAGALSGATHPIIVVQAQRIIPGGMAMASGLILGFMFTSGAIGTFLSGPLADLWGFPLLFQITAGISLSAAFFALVLQKK